MWGSFVTLLGLIGVRGELTRAALVLGFWLFTYALMTTRAALLPDLPFDVVYPKRIVSTGLGAACLWLLARELERRRSRPLASRLGFAGLGVLASALVVLSLRLAWGIVVPAPDSAFNEQARWILTWTGYFVAAIALHQAIDGAAHALAPAQSTPPVAPSPYPTEIRVSRNQSIVLVAVADVRWFEADGNYVQVFGANGPEGWLRSSMRALGDDLDPALFIRLHRSVICARRIVRGVRRRPSGALTALLDGGEELPIGRAHAADVLALLGLAETSVPESRRSSPDDAAA